MKRPTFLSPSFNLIILSWLWSWLWLTLFILPAWAHPAASKPQLKTTPVATFNAPPKINDFPKVRKISFTLGLPDGHLLQAQLRIPRSISAPLPAWLVFGGFENSHDVLELLRPSDPVVLASFSYPYSMPQAFHFPQDLFEFFRIARDIRHAVKDTLTGIDLLVDELKKMPEVNSREMGIVGASFGSPFALIAAEKQPRFLKRIVLVHGFSDLSATIANRLKQILTPRLGTLASWVSPGLAELIVWVLDAPSPETAARSLKGDQLCLLIEATQDQWIPENARTSLWNALQSSQASVQRILRQEEHLMPGAQNRIDEILGVILDWWKKNS